MMSRSRVFIATVVIAVSLGVTGCGERHEEITADLGDASGATGELVVEEVGPGLISTELIDDGVAILPDGSLIVSRREGEWGGPSEPSSLWIHEVDGGTWREGIRLFPDFPDASDPALSSDGRRLVFTSSHDAGGTSDLWISQFDGGKWQEPERLGGMINTPGYEMGASLGSDGTLYFSSTREGSAGSGDIWVARPDSSGFLQPEPLGEGVNSPTGEWNATVASDGRWLIFEASERSTNLSIPGDLYISWDTGSGWSRAVPLAELNTTGSDLAARVADGWLWFVSSGRDGTGKTDIFRVDASILERYRP